MAERQPRTWGKGKITAEIQADTSVRKTIEFICKQLPQWRDDPTRSGEDAEPKLNFQLCVFLAVKARSEFSMVIFHQEIPQAGRHRVDLAAFPAEPTIIEARPYSIYEPILVLEGKRLPAPSADRQMEYVTGRDRRDGGIHASSLAGTGRS